MDPTEIGFLKAIDEDPESATDKLVYADWLNDQDREDEERAWRWLVARGKVPRHRLWYDEVGRGVSERNRRGWFIKGVFFEDAYANHPASRRVVDREQLSSVLLPLTNWGDRIFYSSASEAYLGFVARYVELAELLRVEVEE